MEHIEHIDLKPAPDQVYWTIDRHWNEEVIYFLLVDRFCDGNARMIIREGVPVDWRTGELESVCGGNLNGIRANLPYLKQLGITAIWLSPVMENNPESYHGYAIQVFLSVDPRFGTLDDLKALIREAHALDLRVILDIVINHTGNNWHYSEHRHPVYYRGRRYDFGAWRYPDKPKPLELRNEKYYRKQGEIRRWDAFPETREGDFFSLKKLLLDESADGLQVQEILLKIYAYWIKETDCDGFRIDTVKHAGMLPVSRFCEGIRAYCESIGKKDFFLFGELTGGDPLLAASLSGSEDNQERFYNGPDSLLDFPLHFVLEAVIKGKEPFKYLKKRFKSKERYKLGAPHRRYDLVTFLDNHDQVGAVLKKRIGAEMSEKELLAALAILFFLPGIPCMYYGTEQHLRGAGTTDGCIREPMFSSDGRFSLLNPRKWLYGEIARLCEARKNAGVFGLPELFFNEQFEDAECLRKVPGEEKMLVFSRLSPDEQLVLLFNQQNIPKTIYVKILRPLIRADFVYSIENPHVELVNSMPESRSSGLIKALLAPGELVIIK